MSASHLGSEVLVLYFYLTPLLTQSSWSLKSWTISVFFCYARRHVKDASQLVSSYFVQYCISKACAFFESYKFCSLRILMQIALTAIIHVSKGYCCMIFAWFGGHQIWHLYHKTKEDEFHWTRLLDWSYSKMHQKSLPTIGIVGLYLQSRFIILVCFLNWIEKRIRFTTWQVNEVSKYIIDVWVLSLFPL